MKNPVVSCLLGAVMSAVMGVLMCASVSLAQGRDPAALLKQAAALEAAKKWDAAGEAYSAAGDALMAAGRMAEAAAALKKVATMYEHVANDLIQGDPTQGAPAAPPPARPAQVPQQQPPRTAAPAAPVTIPAGQEFQSARQCVPGTAVKIAPGPGAPNGGTGRIASAAAADDLLCKVAVDGAGTQSIIYWRLVSTDPNTKPITHVILPPGSEFKSTKDCTPGRAVTIGENLPYDEGGPAVVVGAKDELSCTVTMTKTGKQSNVVYWRAAPQGAVAHYPARIVSGNYGCGTFAGIVSLNSNIAGRPEPRPLFDVNVTGANAYIGSDGARGTFTYDNTKGEVRFTGGVHNGRVAGFRDNGGQGMFVFKSETGEIDCGL